MRNTYLIIQWCFTSLYNILGNRHLGNLIDGNLRNPSDKRFLMSETYVLYSPKVAFNSLVLVNCSGTEPIFWAQLILKESLPKAWYHVLPITGIGMDIYPKMYTFMKSYFCLSREADLQLRSSLVLQVSCWNCSTLCKWIAAFYTRIKRKMLF